MADIANLGTIWDELFNNNVFNRISNEPQSQFGRPSNPFLFAPILPEETTIENNYEDERVIWLTYPALESTDYSPAQLQDDGLLSTRFNVRLGNQNTASQLTGAKLDRLMKLANNRGTGGTAGVITELTNFYANTADRISLRNEIMRGEALLTRSIMRRGTGGFEELVEYPVETDSYWVANYDPESPNPGDGSGTVDEPEGWYCTQDSAVQYNPIAEDLLRAKDTLEDKGYRINGIYMDRHLANVFQRNPVIQKLTNSRWVVEVTGEVGTATQRASRAAMNALLEDNELPPITVYNDGYSLPGIRPGARQFGRFMHPSGVLMKRHLILITSMTNESSELYWEEKDQSMLLNNLLGRFMVGVCTGEANPGRRTYTYIDNKHPLHIYNEIIQKGLPVVHHPGGIITIAVDEPLLPEELDEYRSRPAIWRDFAVA